IWDVSAGRAIGDVNHPSGLSTGAWSPNDQLLAAGHSDGTVTISGVPLTLPSPPSPGGEGRVRGTSAGSKITTLRAHADSVFDLAWSPDSARLVSSSGDFRAKIWEVASGKMVIGPLRHSHGITSVAWEPNSRRLATGSVDETVKIWDAVTGREV